MEHVALSSSDRVALTVAFAFTVVFKILLVMTLPIAVVLLCVHGRGDLSVFGDCSYGLYLWGFPVQQTVVHFIPDMSPVSLFAVAGSIAFVCALLSWHGVEKSALKRRKPKDKLMARMAWLPGRG